MSSGGIAPSAQVSWNEKGCPAEPAMHPSGARSRSRNAFSPSAKTLSYVWRVGPAERTVTCRYVPLRTRYVVTVTALIFLVLYTCCVTAFFYLLCMHTDTYSIQKWSSKNVAPTSRPAQDGISTTGHHAGGLVSRAQCHLPLPHLIMRSVIRVCLYLPIVTKLDLMKDAFKSNYF